MANNGNNLEPDQITNLSRVLANYGQNSEQLAQSIEKAAIAGKKLDKVFKKQLDRAYKDTAKDVRDLEQRIKKLFDAEGDLTEEEIKQYRVLKARRDELTKGMSAMVAATQAADDHAEKTSILSRRFSTLGEATSALRGEFPLLSRAVDAAYNIISAVYESWFSWQSNITQSMGQMAQQTGFTGDALGNLGDVAESMRDTFQNLGDEVNGTQSYQFIQELAPAIRDASLMTEEFSLQMYALSRGFNLGAENSARLFRLLQSGFDGSHRTISEFGAQMETFANSIGASAGQLAGEYVELRSQIAQFGAEGEAAFRGAAEMAQEFGFQSRVIFDMASRFDTFSAASDSVNQLNAMLGTSISSFELMMEQDPARRVEMVRQAVMAEGRMWSDLTRQERQLLAQQTGQSEEILAQIFSGQGRTLDQIQAEQQAEADRQMALQRNREDAEERMQEILAGTSTLYRSINRVIQEVASRLGRDLAPLFSEIQSIAVDLGVEFGHFLHDLLSTEEGRRQIEAMVQDVRDFGNALRQVQGFLQDVQTVATGIRIIFNEITAAVQAMLGLIETSLSGLSRIIPGLNATNLAGILGEQADQNFQASGQSGMRALAATRDLARSHPELVPSFMSGMMNQLPQEAPTKPSRVSEVLVSALGRASRSGAGNSQGEDGTESGATGILPTVSVVDTTDTTSASTPSVSSGGRSEIVVHNNINARVELDGRQVGRVFVETAQGR